MRLDGGIIGSLELTHTPDGRRWIIRRSWEHREIPGVEIQQLANHPSLIHDWHKISNSDPLDVWHIELEPTEFDPNSAPNIESLESLERQLAPYRQSKIKLPSDLAKRLDESILQITKLVEAFANSGKAIGFLCPSSVQWLGKRLFLADAGFVWNRELAALRPKWLDSDEGSAYFWDLSPKEINSALTNNDANKLAEHDQRVLARMIAAVLLGPNKLIVENGKQGFKIPDSDLAPEIQNSSFFKLLVSIVNHRKPVPWDVFHTQLAEYRPSRFFEPPPPPPPPNPWPMIRRLVVAGVLVGILVAGWAFRKTIWPPPPPSPVLCPDCPGTSQLREAADELAQLWDSSPVITTAQLDQELKLLERVHDSQRTPQIAEREEECLAILRVRFDERLGVAAIQVIQELTGNPPNSAAACQLLSGVRQLAERLDQLAEKSSSNNVMNSLPKEPAEWRRKINSLMRSYHCP